MTTDLVLKKPELNLGFSKIYEVEIIKPKTLTQLKKIDKNNINIVEGSNLNRKILENRKVDILLSPEKGRKEDYIHQRNSGLNHILAKIASKNKIAIGINFSDILKANNEERAKLIGRIKQNIKLCRKYKVKMIIATFASNKYELRSVKDLENFALVLGMNTKEAKESLTNYGLILKERDFKEGIKLIT